MKHDTVDQDKITTQILSSHFSDKLLERDLEYSSKTAPKDTNRTASMENYNRHDKEDQNNITKQILLF